MTVSEELLATFKYFNEAAKYANDYFEEHIKLNFTKNVTISIRDTLKGEGAPDCLVLKLT
ncbi:hypothetical protein M0R19_04925 [Candidatus Pacearchaeota archaeon]|jgi:hypothetical protein|nr:hypothetical protein [Candidatus Pacearchaeota archaeon]